MFLKLGIIFAVPLVLMGGFLLVTDTVVVDVREGGPDGHHIVVPVPLPLAQLALNFAPEEETTITCPELWRYRDAIGRVVEELRKAPDGELVRVEEADTFVSIRKEGSQLLVYVEEDESTVKVKFPLKAVKRFLARLDGDTFTARDLLASASNTMHGQVVHVRDGDDEVKISVW